MLETPKLMSIGEVQDVFESGETTYQKGLVRPYPEAVCDTVQSMIHEGKDLSEVIAYGRGSFEIFRSSVNSGFDIPHVSDGNGLYEWPVPGAFDWTDVSAVTAKSSRISSNTSSVRIFVPGRVRDLDVDMGRMRVRDLTLGEAEAMNMGRDFKYLIPSLSSVGVVKVYQEWQAYLLKSVHNKLGVLNTYLMEGSIADRTAQDKIMEIMEVAKSPRPDNLKVITS